MQKTAAHTLEEAVLRALLSGHKLTILGGGHFTTEETEAEFQRQMGPQKSSWVAQG